MQQTIYASFQKDITRSYQALTKQQEYHLVTRAQNGCIKSRNKLVESQIPAIISIAKMYVNTNERNVMGDLVGDGVLGLTNAISDFDITYGIRLYSFAFNYIRNNIRDNSVDNVLIRNSRQKSKSRILSEEEVLMYHPDDIEKVNGKNRLKAEVFKAISLDAPVSEDGSSNVTFGDIIGDNTRTDECTDGHDVDRLMGILDADEQKILQMHYGLNGYNATTLADIGSDMVPSVSRQAMFIKMNKIKEKLRMKFVQVI